MLRGSHRVSRLLLVFSCLSGLAVNAEATQLIDDFTGTGGVLGTAAIGDVAAGDTAKITTICCGGIFEYAGSDHGWDLTYGGQTAVDLTLGGDNALEIDVRTIIPDQGPSRVKVTASNTMLGTSSSTPLFINLNLGPNAISYADFVGTATFTSVDRLKFEFQSNVSYGTQLNMIQTIPEPATAMMLGLGLMGLASWGRQRVA